MAYEIDQSLGLPEVILSNGGKVPPIAVVRRLGMEDVPLLVGNEPVQRPDLSQEGYTPTRLRATHHELARLLAKGTPPADCTMLTGHSVATINRLQKSPAFQDLLSHYNAERDQIFVDVMERMKAVGLATLDELQERFENGAEDFTKKELLEITELMLIKSRAAVSGGGHGPGFGPAGPVNVSISFVNPNSGSAQTELPPIIDADPQPLPISPMAPVTLPPLPDLEPSDGDR